jgi:hypothetical protein
VLLPLLCWQAPQYTPLILSAKQTTKKANHVAVNIAVALIAFAVLLVAAAAEALVLNKQRLL